MGAGSSVTILSQLSSEKRKKSDFMDIELSERTLKMIGVAVFVVVILAAIVLYLEGTDPQKPKVLLSKSELISQICANKDLAIKYDQDPSSTHPQLVKIRSLVQQYEQLTGTKFVLSLCGI